MKTLGEAGGKYFMNKNLIVPGAPLEKEFEEREFDTIEDALEWLSNDVLIDPDIECKNIKIVIEK